ncbi:MAG: DUF2304 domain-containing protein [Candidatus Omnitrophota bacterium]|jgi:hypothetical protein
MTYRQKIFAILISAILMVIIIELVRRKKLREEFSWLWLSAGFFIICLSIWDFILIKFANLMGIMTPVGTILFFLIAFVFFIVLHFSIKISTLTDQVKNLTQEVAIIKSLSDNTGKGQAWRQGL